MINNAAGSRPVEHTNLDLFEYINKELTSEMKAMMSIARIGIWTHDTNSDYLQYIGFADDIYASNELSIVNIEQYFDVVGPDDVHKVKAYIEAMSRGGEIKEVKYKTLDLNGKPEYLDNRIISCRKNDDGDGYFVLGYVQNITRQALLEQELIKAKEKAEESERLKSAFLANVSHEIRTPLNAIVGFSELMAETNDKNDKEDFVKIIKTNSEVLLNLVGDILDSSKLESKNIELNYTSFDMASVFDEVSASVKRKKLNGEVEFIGVCPYEQCVVRLDKHRLIQVLTNFITNSIKYTSKGYIKIGCLYENGGVKIYVEDTGIGIAPSKQSKVFGRFEKLDDYAQGTGLGLSICKAITEVMGGKIGFESEQGKGSTFWAWFATSAQIVGQCGEVDAPDEVMYVKERTTNAQKRDLNLLVAEDNDSNYLLLKAMLKGCSLTRATNGIEAVNYARQSKFDVILMDMKMPVMGGIEATRLIREFDAEIPIVAVTANAFDSDRDSAVQAGCNYFVTKPLRRTELEQVLTAL